MTKAEKDAFDFYMPMNLDKLYNEIKKSGIYINQHPRNFKYLKDEIDFKWQEERLQLLNAIYDLRTNKISQEEFDSLYKQNKL